MLLTVDCGNTQIVLGLYSDNQLINHWRISTVAQKTEDEYFVLLDHMLSRANLHLSDVDGFIVSSVVPAVTFALRKFAEKYLNFPGFFVDHTTKTPIKVLTDNPWEVGADRIVNALAAHTKYSGYLIVVDFG
ncbi:MAG: type III pantothenate kinase, partial [Clostridiales bacterium]